MISGFLCVSCALKLDQWAINRKGVYFQNIQLFRREVTNEIGWKKHSQSADTTVIAQERKVY
jgi:hypothetical protein